MNTAYTATAVSDLFDAGRTADGDSFIAEAFYVLIENARGTRFRHVATFRTTEMLICEETGESYFPNLREEATAKAERLAARVNAAFATGKGVDWAYWIEVDPAYGSDEYLAQGIEFQRAYADRQAA
jgi:hypothetical protein